MGLKETLAKQILELKLNNATKHLQSTIQKLQQKYDELVSENKKKQVNFFDYFFEKSWDFIWKSQLFFVCLHCND